MICNNCSKLISNSLTVCPHCKADPRKELTDEEKKHRELVNAINKCSEKLSTIKNCALFFVLLAIISIFVWMAYNL